MADLRGIRNNNPGNIERTGDRWLGMCPQQTDPRFVVFDRAEHGIRALAKLLLTYSDRYELHNVARLIHRWAPPGENDTADYIHSVAGRMKVEPDQDIDLHDPAILTVLVNAIIAHENANYAYAPAIVAAGIGLALGKTVEVPHVAA